jgi:FAD:protein FMN transferase
MTSTRMVTFIRPRMGTLLALTLPASSAGSHPRRVAALFDIARRYEGVMSRHDSTSDLARLNRSAGSPAGVASRDLARIVRAACRLSRHLHGAFDPTVGSVGPDAIEMAGDRVALSHPRSAIDLDGFGKGLTLDRIAAWLRRRRYGAAFLNFGESSLIAVGRPPRGPWSVLLRNPFGGFAGAFTLEDRACSTSATFARPARIGRRVTSDVIDPRTGQPVRHDAQVTVLASSAATAEAISTALLVLGRDAVDEIARRMRVDVCWVDRSEIYTVPRRLLRRGCP